MTQFHFHRVTQKDGATYVSLLETPDYEACPAVAQVKTYPLLHVQNLDVEGGVAALMTLEKWLGDEPFSNLLEAVFDQGYQAGKASAAS